jgi:2-phosphoglycerate kinase
MCTRLAATSDKVYQLLANDRWFSPGTPASSTTTAGRHDIADILLKVALKHQKYLKKEDKKSIKIQNEQYRLHHVFDILIQKKMLKYQLKKKIQQHHKPRRLRNHGQAAGKLNPLNLD